MSLLNKDSEYADLVRIRSILTLLFDLKAVEYNTMLKAEDILLRQWFDYNFS